MYKAVLKIFQLWCKFLGFYLYLCGHTLNLKRQTINWDMTENKTQRNVPAGQFVSDIQRIIEHGRKQAYAAANQLAVITYWHIGRRIVEEEQHGEACAQYGTHLIKTLAEQLTPKYGSAFNKRNLNYFRQFYLCFSDLEIVNACVHNLTWTHFRSIIKVADPKAREWYAKEVPEEMWSSRTFHPTIGILLCAETDNHLLPFGGGHVRTPKYLS